VLTAADRALLPARLEALRSLPAFLGLGLAQLLRLAGALEEVGFEDGAAVVEEGSSVGWDDTAMFFVLAGAPLAMADGVGTLKVRLGRIVALCYCPSYF
jgi:hypothetical protein